MNTTKKPPRIAIALCLAALCAQLAPSQELVERSVMVLDFAPLAGSSAAYSSLCADTVAIELGRLGYPVLPMADSRTAFKGDALSDAAVIKAARERGMDVAVVGFYLIEGDSLRIAVRALDIQADGAVALSVSESGPAGVDVFDTIDRIAAGVAQKIRAALKPIPKSTITVEREQIRHETVVVEEILELGVPVSLNLLSKDEGASVSAGGEELGAIQEGGLAVDTKDGATLSLLLEKDGYFGRLVTVTARAEAPEARLPRLVRVPGRELAFATGLDRPFGLDAMLRWHFLNGIFAAEALVGFHYVPYRYPEFLWFGSEPLIDAAGGALILGLGGGGRVYPLAIFFPGLMYRPFLGVGVELDGMLMTGETLTPALLARLTLNTGMVVSFPGWNLCLTIKTIPPIYLGLGTVARTELPSLRLLAEVALPW